MNSGLCIDLGSGWGALSFPLTKVFNEVWSLEADRGKIRFQNIRKEQEGISNLKLIRANALELPFPENCFDLVIANGVLEWVGLSDLSRNPREVQLSFLNEIRRVLKPSGCLYLGIENRFGMPYFLGQRDHSGLRFTSIFPRRIADLLVKFSTKGDKPSKVRRYYTYTYSSLGYRKILTEVGFSHIDILGISLLYFARVVWEAI